MLPILVLMIVSTGFIVNGKNISTIKIITDSHTDSWQKREFIPSAKLMKMTE